MLRSIPLVQRIVGGAMLALLLLTCLLWQTEKRRAGKLQDQLITATAELKRISTVKNVQKEATTRTIEKVRIVYRDADKQAERIETAPLPGRAGRCRIRAQKSTAAASSPA